MKENKRTSIRTRILLLIVACIVILSSVMLGMMIYAVRNVGSEESAIAEEKLLDQVKSGLKTGVLSMERNSVSQYEAMRAEVDGVSDEDIEKYVFNNIRNTKYSESGYYFIYSYDGTRLVTPDNPDAEGTNLWDMEDANGVKVIQELITAAKNGGGFVTYQWLNPNTGEEEDKVSYATALKLGDTEYMFGTGTYLPMINETKAEMALSLKAVTSSTLWITIPVIVVLALLALLVLYLFFSRKVINPVMAIDEAANALAGGDTDVQLNVKSNDEIGHLADTIDHEVREAFVSVNRAIEVNKKQTAYTEAQAAKLVDSLEMLSRGELDCDFTVDTGDEDTEAFEMTYASISDNLRKSVASIRRYIAEIAEVLGAMSEGDLTVSIQSEFSGDFATLKESINSIAQSLSGVMSDINTAAEQVAAGTTQVSDGSQAISQGATEQAASIQELSATITEIADQTKKNAESAGEANRLTLVAKGDADKGSERMREMQNAMAEINEASENISKIIKVIDDIAFQTNILALNAAVEAARAGAHGKGFAVVAEEVRNLAARSANAAKETTALIEGSVRKTEAGTKIADETAEALMSIVSGVEQAAQLVGEIAAASETQAGAITQVNDGIDQVNQVVQNNSATSEETAASSEELSSQAELLKNMVSRFRITGEGVYQRQEADKHEAVEEVEAAKEEETPPVLNDTEFGKY